MPTRPQSRCTTTGCPGLTDGGPCDDCRTKRRKDTDKRRGTAAERGYGGRRWRAARRAVLRRDPVCTCTATCPDHGPRCPRPSTASDHYPRERKDLIAAGVADPDAPHLMRGMCEPCHNRKTAATRQGGWNA